jgi:hypothetical protein
MMKLDWKTTALVAGLLLVTRSTAFGVVFDDRTPAQKVRADVGKQIAGYLKCLGRAALACEKTGGSPASECTVETGAVVAPADPKGKFAAAIAKCDAKLDFDRKAPNGSTSAQSYELIACPSYGSGLQFADMDQFQSFARLLKPVIDDLIGSMPFLSGCSDARWCAAEAKVLLDFVNALGKCEQLCENDYKDTKGNGGPTDDLVQCDAAGDPRAALCLDKATDKFLDKAEAWPFGTVVVSQLVPMIDDLNDDLFNAAPNCD